MAEHLPGTPLQRLARQLFCQSPTVATATLHVDLERTINGRHAASKMNLIAVDLGKGGYGRGAAPSQGCQKTPFSLHRAPNLGILDGGQQTASLRIVGSTLDRQRRLTGGRPGEGGNGVGHEPVEEHR